MSHHEITGMRLHRHPFLGQTSPEVRPDWSAVTSPIWAGFIVGYTSYHVAKAMEIPANKAAGLGVTLGAIMAIGQIGSSWLRGHLAKAQAATAPAPAPPQAPQAPQAPATPQAPQTVKGW